MNEMRNLTFTFLVAAAGCAFAQPQQTMHLTLAEAQRLAIANNPRVSVARLTAAAAYEVPKQYSSAMLPSVGASFTGVGADDGSRLGAGALNNPVVYSRLGSGVVVNQLITDFGRTRQLAGMAKYQAQAQDQVTEETRADILLGTSQAYFNVLRNQALLKVANETVTARQLVADQIGALANANLRSQLDVSFANVNLADARLMQVQAQNNVSASEAQLAAIMGLPNQTAFTVADEPMPSPLPDRVSDLISQAIQNRPELSELRLRQNAAESFAKAEHDLYYPSVSAIGSMGVIPQSYNDLPGKYGAVGLNINIPLFNGGLFHARSAEAHLQAQAAAQNITDEQNRIIRDLRVAWLNANSAYDKIALSQQLVNQAKMALDLSESRYQLGLSSFVEVSQAQLNLTGAQIALTNAQYDYQAQHIAVDYQVGTLR